MHLIVKSNSFRLHMMRTLLFLSLLLLPTLRLSAIPPSKPPLQIEVASLHGTVTEVKMGKPNVQHQKPYMFVRLKLEDGKDFKLIGDLYKALRAWTR